MDAKDLQEKLWQFFPRGGIAALTSGIEFMSLWRWGRLSLAVGAVVGLAAVGVYAVLEWGESLLVRGVDIFPPMETEGVGKRILSPGSSISAWWLLLLSPAIGGLIAGLIIWRFAPETRGAGVNEVLDAYHNRKGRIRLRVPIVKLVATLFTLGSGGSAGREGPMAQIGAGVGSYLGSKLGLSARERRLLLLAGAAGGISALFRAPLGAALWSLEILYREDFESDGLFPALVSSVTAYSVFTIIYGQGSLFHVDVGYVFHPAQLVFYGLLALACTPLALFWIGLFRFSQERIWQPMKAPMWLKPAIGGLALGLISIAVPQVFSTGYGWMQDALRTVDDPARLLPIGYKGFALLLLLALGKMLATSLTVCSGGSGGIFAPTLFVGGFIGGAFGLLFHTWAPDIVAQPTAFVLVGMGAFYAALARTPISTIIIISELFSSYDLLVPLMFCEMLTIVLVGNRAIYPKQVRDARHSPAHAGRFTIDILEHLKVADHYSKDRGAEPVPADMTLRDFLAYVSSTADSCFVVKDRGGNLCGIVSLANVRSVVAEGEFLSYMLVTDAMSPLKTISPQHDLRRALKIALACGCQELPVVDQDQPRRVLGMLSQQQIFAAYNAELLRRRLQRERDGDTAIGVVHTATVQTGAVQTGAVQTGAVQTGATQQHTQQPTQPPQSGGPQSKS